MPARNPVQAAQPIEEYAYLRTKQGEKMQELYIWGPPTEAHREWKCPELPNLPTQRLGRALTWRHDYTPRGVFIGECHHSFEDAFRASKRKPLLIEFFGYRIDLKEAEELGDPNGRILNFVVRERGQVLHHLKQFASVTYSSVDEKRDYRRAADFDWQQGPHIQNVPIWKPEAAYWPTSGGQPMTFLKQWNLPDNEVTREYLFNGLAVFLFLHEQDARLTFKTTTQQFDLQTVEEHYAMEDLKERKKRG